MSSILKSFSLLADANRLRILALLRGDELSVAELQEVLSLGQSNISAQLAKLKDAGLVTDRRAGKNRLYRVEMASNDREANAHLLALVESATQEMPEARQDKTALKLVKRKRGDIARAYFDALAGKFGRQYIPGRSWKALGETLLNFVPPLIVVDMGAGEGAVSQMLAQHAKQVIAVDSSEKMVAYGAKLAKEHGFKNLDFRLGDMEEPPVKDGTVDVVLFSQALHHALHPELALAAAFRILKPGGRVVILDLLKHNFEKARLLYADVWLGFSEVNLLEMLEGNGFTGVDVRVVDREPKAPYFQTVLASAVKSVKA